MIGRVTQIVTAVLITGAVALGYAPPAFANVSTSLSPTVEGWYQPNLSCFNPPGCLTFNSLPIPLPAAPPTSPFPARSLHVGLAPGQLETARTYLGLPFPSRFGSITGARLSVPLDISQADGSNAPETAKVQVCLTSDFVEAVEGSIDTPPKADCGRSVTATYVAMPQPHLAADLGPLISGLTTATGLALLPDATKAAQTDSWRVVFSAHDRADSAKTAPATVSLTLADEAAELPVVPQIPTLPDNGTPGSTTIAPSVDTGLAPNPAVDVPVPASPRIGPVQAPSGQAPKAVSVGAAYPVVWLLPLALMVFIPLIALALSKDLQPAAGGQTPPQAARAPSFSRDAGTQRRRSRTNLRAGRAT